jgi:hypothetical protein
VLKILRKYKEISAVVALFSFAMAIFVCEISIDSALHSQIRDRYSLGGNITSISVENRTNANHPLYSTQS